MEENTKHATPDDQLTDLTSALPKKVENENLGDKGEKKHKWNIENAEKELIAAYEKDSETDVLKVLKNNTFLFYDLYTRKMGIQPVFRELNFGAELRCDFAWLNDNSSGPEWVLVEIEKPKMLLFKADGKPTAPFQGALEQVKGWDQYFMENSGEKKRIFGAVAKFRFILVTGTHEEWQTEHGQKWRVYHQNRSHVEVRSMQTFFKSLEEFKTHPADFWSFEKHPQTLPHSELEDYWKNYGYMDRWRMVLD